MLHNGLFGCGAAEILVVEDNLYSAVALTSILEQYSISFTCVFTGKEAIDAVDNRHKEGTAPFKLIIMDLFLPQINGLEAANWIIQHSRLHNTE